MRILLADQDQELSDFVRAGLAQEGFAVDVAHDGDTAYEMAVEGKHDAILIDIVIPKLSGHDVLKKLRSQGNHVPVLIITFKNQEQDKLHSLNNGADDYIVKPFRLAEVIARIRAILRRTDNIGRKTSKTSVLLAGKLELHLLRRELKCASKSIYLTKVEFDLLEYFMRRPGEVISQCVLKQHLFGDESNLDTNALPVHVMNLRKKIDLHERKSLIRTVRSCGYALDA